MRGRPGTGPGIVVSYARATPGMSEEAVRMLASAAKSVDQVTLEEEEAAARAVQLWNDVG